MNKNPYLNAVFAAAYIVLLVSGVFTFGKLGVEEPNMLIPITMLSIFVLSAAVMGYFFVLRPATMYVDGQKREAVDFFVRTVGTFAVLCILLLAALVLMAKS